MLEQVKKGNEIELQVDKLAFGGKAVAREDGFVVFLDHAVPGQRVRALITKKKKQYAEGRVREVVSQSPDYKPPFCPHFGVCGGCSWQDIDYEKQLFWKRSHVIESLGHIAGQTDAVAEPIVPSPQQLYYRNKMEFTFSDRRWLLPEELGAEPPVSNRAFTLGLHVRGFFDKVFNLEECYLESPEAAEIVREAREFARESGLEPYSIRSQEGFWRFLVVREAKRTGQRLVNCITTPLPGGGPVVEKLAARLVSRFPGITSFVHSVSGSKAQVATGESARTLFGSGYIEEMLGDLRFRISANSFFQTNTLGAEKLYGAVVRYGELDGSEAVWDLYCGTGSIAIYLAPKVKSVLGIEVVEDAVRDANENVRLNGVQNCSFRAGDLKDVIGRALEHGAPDIIVTDPPRAGMHPKVVKTLLEISPRRIIAVSCNPATLARDIALLAEKYEITGVQPFDLFPHTPHLECVVRLDRKR
jgi:23S rRNA (uracil1939-C5)-methyltransferase